MTPEGKVKNGIKKVLRELGIWWYMPVQNGMGVVGIPDFICCWNGKFLAIEAKAPGKAENLTPNQKAVMYSIVEANGLHLVIDDVETLRNILSKRRPT